MSAPILEVHELHKRYGSTTALNGVTFQVEEGEIFGLLGPNGAGKTTLLSIVSGLLPASSGSVRILGRELAPRDRELRRQLGIVPQNLAIYGQLTARENLQFFGELYGLTGADLRLRVAEVLAAIGLEDRADRRVDTFSGGMMRRLNLGAALVHRPRLLLLDEPTTGVDPQSRNHIFEEVRRLSHEGATIVYTSHYMEEVQALCPRIGIMDHGRVIACDTLPGLLRLLSGRIRLHTPQVTAPLRDRLSRLPNVRVTERPSENGQVPPLELECPDVKGTLFHLVAALNELRMESVSLETEEPNLERIFLHLTGRQLRD